MKGYPNWFRDLCDQWKPGENVADFYFGPNITMIKNIAPPLLKMPFVPLCDKKAPNGSSHNLKISAWNVAGSSVVAADMPIWENFETFPTNFLSS